MTVSERIMKAEARIAQLCDEVASGSIAALREIYDLERLIAQLRGYRC